MSPKFKVKEANEQYEKLEEYSALRRREITGMMQPIVNLTDRYGRLLARMTCILGRVESRDTQDLVIRDLMADVFDFLYEARPLILSGKFFIAYPLARRAFESLSLLHLCALDPSAAKKWHAGGKISNGEVGHALANHPMGEPEQGMKDLYNFFCKATHPNRDLISQRFLGDGNQFVLGVIGQPNLILTVDYIITFLRMWFWLAATVGYFYRETMRRHDPSLGDTYLRIQADAQQMNKELIDNYKRLLQEERDAGALSGNR